MLLWTDILFQLFFLLFFLILDLLYKQDNIRFVSFPVLKYISKIVIHSSESFSIRDHKKLLKSRGGEMEMTVDEHIDEVGDGVDLDDIKQRLRVVVELDGSQMRVLCEGHCDLDKVVIFNNI